MTYPDPGQQQWRPYNSQPANMAPDEAPKKSRFPLIFGAALAGSFAVAILVVAAWFAVRTERQPQVDASVTSAGLQTFAVTGDLKLTDTGNGWASGEVCSGSGGYRDIQAGAQVVVTDAAGTVVAVGSLSVGIAETFMICRFGFGVAGVPAGRGFYGVEVTHRGQVRYAEADLKSPIEVTLG
jgi:hypothetical protein